MGKDQFWQLLSPTATATALTSHQQPLWGRPGACNGRKRGNILLYGQWCTHTHRTQDAVLCYYIICLSTYNPLWYACCFWFITEVTGGRELSEQQKQEQQPSEWRGGVEKGTGRVNEGHACLNECVWDMGGGEKGKGRMNGWHKREWGRQRAQCARDGEGRKQRREGKPGWRILRHGMSIVVPNKHKIPAWRINRIRKYDNWQV